MCGCEAGFSGDDCSVVGNNAALPALNTPFTVRFGTGLGGFTKATFSSDAQAVYRGSLAQQLTDVQQGDVRVEAIADYQARRRRLSGNSAFGVKLDVQIGADTLATADVLAQEVNLLHGNATAVAKLKAGVKAGLRAKGLSYNTTAFDVVSVAQATTAAKVMNESPARLGGRDTDQSSASKMLSQRCCW